MAIKFDGTKFKNGSTVVGNFYNDKIYEGAYRSKILITIKDAQKNVDCNMNDETVTAAWLMFA